MQKDTTFDIKIVFDERVKHKMLKKSQKNARSTNFFTSFVVVYNEGAVQKHGKKERKEKCTKANTKTELRTA